MKELNRRRRASKTVNGRAKAGKQGGEGRVWYTARQQWGHSSWSALGLTREQLQSKRVTGAPLCPCILVHLRCVTQKLISPGLFSI